MKIKGHKQLLYHPFCTVGKRDLLICEQSKIIPAWKSAQGNVRTPAGKSEI